jgi:Na+/H+ antiporter NhaC
MKPVAIENGVTPEKISAIVASTVSPISSMLPFTPFILFFSGLIVSSVEGYNGYELFIQAIPFQLFAIVSLITSFLMAYEIIPDIGLPISVFVLSIVVFSFTAGSLIVTAGPLTGCIAAIIYSMVNKSVKFNEIMDGCVEGCKDMSDIFLILLFAFSFGQVVNALEFAPYIISLLGSSFPMEFIPVITFLVCCIISYSTGSLSAAAIIVFPLGLPLALATGASIPLTIGACISGSHFGDLYSPISDSIIMPSQASDISPITLSHALTPYRLIQLAICTVLFVIFGYVM